MIKKLFAFFIPTCIISFILFGVSVAVFGKTSVSEAGSESYIDYASFDESYSNIQIDCSGAEINIVKSADNTTRVTEKQGSAVFTVCVGDDTLFVESKSTFFVWDDNLKFWDNIGRLFSNAVHGDYSMDGSEIMVFVPDKLYEEIIVQLNAGTLNINGIAADSNEITINAGTLDYNAPAAEAEYLDVTINAGKGNISGISPREYRLQDNMGDLCVRNLTGLGSVALSAGTIDLIYDNFNRDMQIDISAGTLNMYVPSDTSATVNVNKSAGSVIVETIQNLGEYTIGDGCSYTLGSGKHQIGAYLSAGNLNIRGTDAAPKPAASAATTRTAVSHEYAEIPEVPEVTEIPEYIDSALESAADAIDSAFEAIG